MMMQLPMLSMESFLHFQVTVAIIVILLILIYSPLIPTNSWTSTNTFCWKKKRTNKSTGLPPQPAAAWPIIGHLHLLTNPNMCVYQMLSAMADKYGPTFSLRLGFHQTLVINSWQVAKECFTTNDITFSTRPKSLAMNIMAYNHSMIGAAPYGRYWRALRKFIVLHLLSNQRLQMLKHVRFSEIDLFTKGLYRLWDENGGNGAVLVNVDEKFADMTTNIITRIIAGKRYAGGINTEESRRFQKAFGEFSHLSGLFIVSDAIPFLWALDILNGNCAKMKRVAKEVDNVFSKWVNEHKEKRLAGCIKEEEIDLIHVMLSHLQDGDLANTGYDDDTIIKSTCMGLVLGGNDTTSITMTWALSLLLNNRDALQKAQEELDTHVGRHRLVEESDIKNLSYLEAVLKETMRLQPASPLLAPRQAMEDCKVAGFDIPAGTRLLVNVWKMHRDPNVWPEPLAFKPERFLKQNHNNIDVIGKNFELLPFGCGRRMCPGITFSQQIIHLGLARILQAFEMDTVGGVQVDMTEIPGLTVKKSTPLKVLLRPRVSAQLINNLVI